MSKLTVDNLRKSSESADRDISGVAAAWVNFDGTGVIATRDSLNVSSLTDNGAGTYTVNYTNDMDNVGYVVNANRERNGQYGGVQDYDQRYVGSVRLIAFQENFTTFDSPAIMASNHGDLA